MLYCNGIDHVKTPLQKDFPLLLNHEYFKERRVISAFIHTTFLVTQQAKKLWPWRIPFLRNLQTQVTRRSTFGRHVWPISKKYDIWTKLYRTNNHVAISPPAIWTIFKGLFRWVLASSSRKFPCLLRHFVVSICMDLCAKQ